jgi:hypothetical protein
MIYDALIYSIMYICDEVARRSRNIYIYIYMLPDATSCDDMCVVVVESNVQFVFCAKRPAAFFRWLLRRSIWHAIHHACSLVHPPPGSNLFRRGKLAPKYLCHARNNL